MDTEYLNNEIISTIFMKIRSSIPRPELCRYLWVKWEGNENSVR